MMTQSKKTLGLFIPMLSVSLMLLLMPHQADAKRKSGNSNRNTNVNVNRNRNTNVNVNVNHNHGHHYHPVGRALAVGAAVAVTAAVVGSIVNTLPPGCTTIIRAGIAYQQCGSVWYQPQYAGNNVTYVVIQQP